MLVTLTDNGKFGSTYSAKKVSLDGPVQADPFGNTSSGPMATAAAAMEDDFEPFDPDAEAVGGNADIVEDSIETQQLLGDRKSQEVGELLTMSLFRMLQVLPKFSGLESIVLQVSILTLRRSPNEKML